MKGFSDWGYFEREYVRILGLPADTGAFDCDGDISFWELLAFAFLKAVEVGFGLFDP